MLLTIARHYLRLCVFQPVVLLLLGLFAGLILLAHHPATTLFAFGQGAYMRAQLAVSSLGLASILAIVFATATLSRQHEDQELAWLLVKPVKGMILSASWFLAIFATAMFVLLPLATLELLLSPKNPLAVRAEAWAMAHILMQGAVLAALAVPIAARWRFPMSSLFVFIIFIIGMLNDHLRIILPIPEHILPVHPLVLLPSLNRYALDPLLQQPADPPARLLLLNAASASLWVIVGLSLGARALRGAPRD